MKYGDMLRIKLIRTINFWYILFYFSSWTDKNVLEVAFIFRIRYEISQNGYQKSNNSYENSIERLLDGVL